MQIDLCFFRNADGWRWRLRAIPGQHIIGASTQAYARQDQARLNLETVTRIRIPVLRGEVCAEFDVNPRTRRAKRRAS